MSLPPRSRSEVLLELLSVFRAEPFGEPLPKDPVIDSNAERMFFLALVCAVAVVDGLDAAVEHIERYGSSHTEAIVTRDPTSADRNFCVQYRLAWIAPPSGANGANPTALLRAEIRVVWSRLEWGPPTCAR